MRDPVTTVPGLARRDLLRGAAGATALAALPARAAGGRLDPVLADLHHRTFRYFWDTADQNTGLVPDNWPNPDFCSVAALGFALSAYPIGVESGYVPAPPPPGRRFRRSARSGTARKGRGPAAPPDTRASSTTSST